jgi:glycerol kinase
LAGLAVGFCSILDIIDKRNIQSSFSSKMSSDKRDLLYGDWLKAIEKTKNWVD